MSDLLVGATARKPVAVSHYPQPDILIADVCDRLQILISCRLKLSEAVNRRKKLNGIFDVQCV